MLKSVFMLVIFCSGGFPSISGETLQCNFGDVNYFGNLYSCSVTTLENPNDNIIITRYSGNHNYNKNDNDVKAIYIHDTTTKYIPEGLGSLFNLTAFIIYNSQLIEIKAENFLGMQNLENLRLNLNKLTSLPSDAFSSLEKLKYIDLESNQIKYIGSGAFDQLTKLLKVDFNRNICVNKVYSGIYGISQMKKDIISNCKNLNEVLATTTTTSTQNPLVVELNNLKNELFEAEKKQNWNENELKKLVALKKNLNKNQQEKILLIKENKVLKNELTAAKDENEKKIFGYETIEQKNKELMKEKDALTINHNALKNKHDALVQSINGEALQCKFQDLGLIWGSMYTCKVSSYDNSRNDKVINSHTGTHLANKNDKDVKAIWIQGTNMKYIPEGLGSLFSLLALRIRVSELIEIRSKDFLGMQNLEYLSLSFNKLTSVPSDTFSSLTKLKLIYLHSNQIKYIGSGAFNQLTNLNEVYLSGNICVDNSYNGNIEITQMKEEIKVKCKNPDEVATTQNPMEVELGALKNELAKATEELQKEKSENLKIKIERDAWIEEKDALMKDGYALKIELNNKSSEINELKEALQKMSLKLDIKHTECETKTQELMSKISHLIQPTEEELICDFNDEAYNILGLLYSCDVTSLDNKCNNKVIKGQNGVHQVDKNASNVEAIYIYNTNATHIPKGLGSLFNLTAFQMFNSQLKEIRTKDFENMENLEYFNFDYNKLTSVPLEVLKMLNKLKYISLQSNLISELTPGLFDHNLELVEVYLDRNKIQIIGSGFFNRLTKLTIVHMTGNKCVDKMYEGSTEMVQMRKDVELNCKDQQ